MAEIDETRFRFKISSKHMIGFAEDESGLQKQLELAKKIPGEVIVYERNEKITPRPACDHDYQDGLETGEIIEQKGSNPLDPLDGMDIHVFTRVCMKCGEREGEWKEINRFNSVDENTIPKCPRCGCDLEEDKKLSELICSECDWRNDE